MKLKQQQIQAMEQETEEQPLMATNKKITQSSPQVNKTLGDK